jgi:hypothetical protein
LTSFVAPALGSEVFNFSWLSARVIHYLNQSTPVGTCKGEFPQKM